MPTLDTLRARYPDIPPSVMLKLDLLRRGVRVGAHVQGSVVLPDGTTVFVAENPRSAYLLERTADGGLRLSEGPGRTPICEAAPGPRFDWTNRRTSQQMPMATVCTPSLGGVCGPVTVSLRRHCEFSVDGDQCRFCAGVRTEDSPEMRPDAVDFRETLAAIYEEQQSIGYLAFSGGSLFNRTKEADAFVQDMRAVTSTGLTLPPSVAAIQALDATDSRRLRDAGFDYVCYSMEVWDDQAWEDVLPGKSRSVGRDHWMKCLVDAVDVFGEGRVLCNFVAGVESTLTDFYPTPETAAEATLEGMRWCYEQGIYPKYAAWVVSPGAPYGDRAPASLDYYAHLIRGRQQLYEDFPMAVPETDCRYCLTQSVEADLAVLAPVRFGRGPAVAFGDSSRHRVAQVFARAEGPHPETSAEGRSPVES